MFTSETRLQKRGLSRRLHDFFGKAKRNACYISRSEGADVISVTPMGLPNTSRDRRTDPVPDVGPKARSFPH